MEGKRAVFVTEEWYQVLVDSEQLGYHVRRERCLGSELQKPISNAYGSGCG